MPQYMLSVQTTTAEPRGSMTEEQQREGYAKISGLEAEMEAANALVFSARLGQPAEGRWSVDAARVDRRPPTGHSPRRRSILVAST
jgi:hypothetical protein